MVKPDHGMLPTTQRTEISARPERIPTGFKTWQQRCHLPKQPPPVAEQNIWKSGCLKSEKQTDRKTQYHAHRDSGNSNRRNEQRRRRRSSPEQNRRGGAQPPR
ncbi:hypothetical protein A2U01_0034571 [Trifolium medium]|uniref:Uncharacterized protein n=1 Tax=Trifolium medium TaxID=97028 RepID=A0A392PMY1_9FABA|nr:hypothetical protein [Trifolium medium]